MAKDEVGADQAKRPPAMPTVNEIGFADLREVLKKGLADFMAAPQFGLFFGAAFALGGIVIALSLTVWDENRYTGGDATEVVSILGAEQPDQQLDPEPPVNRLMSPPFGEHVRKITSKARFMASYQPE